MIPHAGGLEAPASSPLAFPVTMIEAAFEALAMAATGPPEALRARRHGAARAAVHLAPIAAPAERKECLAARTAGQPEGVARRVQGIGVRPDDGTPHATPELPKTCDNPGRSSLCLEDRGSSTRGLGAPTPGPHFVRGGTVGEAGTPTPPTPSPEPGRQAGVGRSALRAEARPAALRGAFAPGSWTPWIGQIGARTRLWRSAQITTRGSENATFR